MKTSILFYCLFFTVFIFSQQKSGKVVYRIIGDSSSLLITNEDDEMSISSKRMLQKSLEIVKNFTYTLQFNENESLFFFKETLQNDSKKISGEFYIARALVGKGIYYQDKINNLVLKQISLSGGDYLISNSLKSDWKITKETKTINGLLCYKASRKCETCQKKKEEVVWFTPEIPIPFGPIGYGGLPGLIVEVQKGLLITIQVEKIKYIDEEICIEEPVKGKRITLEEFNKLTQEFRKKASEF